jgi:VWFA-related protein
MAGIMAKTAHRTRWLAALLLTLGSASFLAAQDNAGTLQASQPPEDLVIRKSVHRVVVDVVVTDSSGKPVRALTQQDFSVTEDGDPQKVLSFDVHGVDSPAEFVPPKLPSLPANTFVNVPPSAERGPLNVILLDLLDMTTEDQPFARAQLSDFINNKPEGARFAVFVLSDGLHLVQGFTDDRKQLLEVLNSRHSGHVPKMFLYADNYLPYVSSLGALIDIADYLSGLPGHKNVIWLAGSFPYFTLPGSDTGHSERPFISSTTMTVRLVDEVKEMTGALTRAQAAVYPVDVRGVTGGWSTGQNTALNASYIIEDSIAEATGGHAFYSTNDVKTALVEATQSGANYYQLSYTPTNENYNGNLRHIKVELAKGGCKLAYRRSYFADNPDAPPPSRTAQEMEIFQQPGVIQPGSSLYINMQHGAPVAHQLVFGAHVHAVGGPAPATPEQMANLAQQPAYFKDRWNRRPAKHVRPVKLQTYVIDYKVLARQLGRERSAEEGGPPATVELAAAAFDDDGIMLNAIVQKAELTGLSVHKTKQKDFYDVEERIEVPVNAAWLRFAMRDVSADRIGAVEVRLPLAPESASARPAPGSDSSSEAKPN